MADETPEVAQGSTSVPIEDFWAEQDAETSAEPETPEPSPAAPEPKQSAPVAAVEPQAEPGITPPPTAAPPPPEIVTYRGQRIDLSQIPENIRDTVRAAATSAEQLPALQEKYMKALEESRQAQAAPTAPPPPEVTPTQVKEAYKNRIAKGIQTGHISADFNEMWPDELAQGMLTRDISLMALQTASRIERQLSSQGFEQEVDRFIADHEVALLRLSEADPFFAPLKDAPTREQFKGFLVRFNPTLSEANDTADYLRRMFVAFNTDAVLAAQKASTQKVTEDRNRMKRQAIGEGSRARVGGPAPPLDARAKQMEEIFGDS